VFGNEQFYVRLRSGQMTNEIYMYDLWMPDLFTIHELTIHVLYSVRKLFTGFAIAALMD